ncbi:MAG: hypothetical protein AMJ59_07730 [Gammaproteobacteria bacterium SG8_31]|jgi:hypothetical protein|nr:MAG: hypothetical protein AMJ59_07730 [Gammaproteobacteria bacterium SG8_31]
MPTLTTPAVITLILAISLAGVLGYLAVVLWRKVYHSTRMVLGRLGRHRLSDLVLPDGMDGEIHVDHLFLTTRGILVLELRNASGAVFAGENLDEWRVIDRARRYSFRNPLPGLEARVHAVETLAGTVPVLGRVAIVGEVTFAGGCPRSVATLAEVAEEFNTKRKTAEATTLSDDYMEAWKRIREAIRQASD